MRQIPPPGLSSTQCITLTADVICRSWPPSIVHDAIKVFTTSGGLPPHKDQGDTPQDQLEKAIACTVPSWPHRWKGFGPPFLLPWFRLKQALELVNSAALRHVGHPQLNWVDQQHREATQAMPEGPPAQLQSTAEPEEGPARGPAPRPARGLVPAWPGLKPCRRRDGGIFMSLSAYAPSTVNPKVLLTNSTAANLQQDAPRFHLSRLKKTKSPSPHMPTDGPSSLPESSPEIQS
ncbi:uncharacterized protein [Saccopteryx bilineata]|uniref:uncharacterized protein n=1 Tax=Saccopteryx bilineata TaxID=59482 RepID=UPI00338FAA1D